MGTIVQFPVRNKGRVRKSTSAAAEGMLAIHQLGATGDNIEIFNGHRADQIERGDFIAYLVETMLNKMPPDFRKGVRQRALADAALGTSDRRRVIGALVAEALTPACRA